MNFGRSNNPMFNQKKIAKVKALDTELYGGDPSGGAFVRETMTASGAVNKTVLLTMVLLAVSVFSYTMPM